MGVVLLTFVATLGIVLASYWALILRPEAQAVGRLRQRLQVDAVGTAMASGLFKGTAVAADAAPGGWRRLLSGADALVENAGMRVDARRLIAGTLAAFVVVVLALRAANADWMIALAAALVTPLPPYIFLRRAAARRLDKFEEAFPDALDLMARALRAGHALTWTMAMIAEEAQEPVRGEFRRIYEMHQYGLPLPQVLRTLASRNPLIDVRFFVTAVLTQRETGGNLAEVLDHLATSTRDRFRVRRQLRVLTAQGRMTGWVLALFPIVLAALMAAVNPSHIRTLVDDPTGQRMLFGAVALQVIGTALIRKIVTVEY